MVTIEDAVCIKNLVKMGQVWCVFKTMDYYSALNDSDLDIQYSREF